MFTLEDMITFAWAFFIVLPLTALIHAAGHAFFIWIFGGKTNLILGRGRKIFSIGILDIRTLYFIDSACYYEKIKKEKRWKHGLIYAGGIIFNALSIFLVNTFIYMDIFPKHLFFYQFVYFSIYYIFYAVLPIDYGKNNPSDGKAIYEVLRYGKIYNEFS
ncbi:MAG TPA: hypothetical protein VEY51_03755 [Chondromyces sp.]|nr:hypothetical protein [Chondromyces sp.]